MTLRSSDGPVTGTSLSGSAREETSKEGEDGGVPAVPPDPVLMVWNDPMDGSPRNRGGTGFFRGGVGGGVGWVCTEEAIAGAASG